MTSTIKEHLIAARALIDTPEKWIKGSSRVGSRYCALGAVKGLTGRMYCPERDALVAALPDGWVKSVANYNDDPATTHDDIISLFDRAIAAQEPRHAG